MVTSPPPTSDDALFVRKAIRLSREHMLAGHGGPFGAVIVRSGQVIAEGWNQVTSTNDPTAHAEVVAIRSACASEGKPFLKDCTLYASCEPCPMCLAAIYWARVGRLVFAASREDAAGGGFADNHIYEEIPKPFSGRSLATTQMLRAEAASVFTDWLGKPDRRPY